MFKPVPEAWLAVVERSMRSPALPFDLTMPARLVPTTGALALFSGGGVPISAANRAALAAVSLARWMLKSRS